MERQRRSIGREFQSTLPVRGATSTFRKFEIRKKISIHAPRAGSDQEIVDFMGELVHFNPRSPCGERLSAKTS